MGWARFDDRRADNPKLMAAGYEARGLDEAAICWCAGHDTDGYIPQTAVAMLSVGHSCKNWRKLASKLVQVGRWVEADGGWTIHDFLDFNRSTSQMVEVRALRADAGRKGGIRSGQNRSKPQPPGEANGKQSASILLQANGKQEVEAKSNPVPSRPVPSRPDPKSFGINLSSSSNALPDPPPKTDDDEISSAKLSKALAIVADRRTLAAGTNPGNPAGYRAKVVANLRDELGEAIAAAPSGLTVDDLVDHLEPAAGARTTRPVETTQAAGTAMREDHDARTERPCSTCDGTRFVGDPDAGMTKCPDCAGTGIAA